MNYYIESTYKDLVYRKCSYFFIYWMFNKHFKPKQFQNNFWSVLILQSFSFHKRLLSKMDRIFTKWQNTKKKEKKRKENPNSSYHHFILPLISFTSKPSKSLISSKFKKCLLNWTFHYFLHYCVSTQCYHFYYCRCLSNDVSGPTPNLLHSLSPTSSQDLL
jgi:hypothetical protein